MSSYLTFYLVPKKTKTIYNKEGVHSEIKVSEGTPLALFSFTRSSEVYEAFTTSLNVAYCGTDSDNYTELSKEDVALVIQDYKREIQSIEDRLKIDYKILRESGYTSEMWEEIHSFEKFLQEKKDSLETLLNISYIVSDIPYSDFDKVLINID